jgi:intracellular sulfur oxidation DsrE/DsrF family protein
MVRGVWIALLVLVSGTLTMAAAQERKPDQGATKPGESGWTYPVIKGYGAAWNLPDAEAQPQKTRTYKVLFSLSRPAEKPDEVLPGLDHMARMFNVFATRGVPPKNLKVVGVFHGPAASYAAMSNEVYKAKFGVDNPNAKVIQELRAAGVKLLLCGQALHGLNLNEKDMLPDVRLATSALIVLATYQSDGYALMPF